MAVAVRGPGAGVWSAWGGELRAPLPETPRRTPSPPHARNRERGTRADARDAGDAWRTGRQRRAPPARGAGPLRMARSRRTRCGRARTGRWSTASRPPRAGLPACPGMSPPPLYGPGTLRSRATRRVSPHRSALAGAPVHHGAPPAENGAGPVRRARSGPTRGIGEPRPGLQARGPRGDRMTAARRARTVLGTPGSRLDEERPRGAPPHGASAPRNNARRARRRPASAHLVPPPRRCRAPRRAPCRPPAGVTPGHRRRSGASPSAPSR